MHARLTRDLGKADQLAVVVQDPVDDDARPETAAIPTKPPAFAFEVVDGRGCRQGILRLACGAVLVAVEALEVLADDLVGTIALEAFGTAVPAGYRAVGIAHLDAMVGHGVDQAAILRFIIVNYP